MKRIVKGDSMPRGSNIEHTRLKMFLWDYSIASAEKSVSGFIMRVSFLNFHFCPRTLTVSLVSSMSSVGFFSEHPVQ